MIVNLRGTGGSGKSTVVKRIMNLYPDAGMHIERLEGRRQPIAYRFHREEEGRDLYIPGHYETPCGGCDTITSVNDVYRLVRNAAFHPDLDVLFEGIMVQDDVARCVNLHREFPGKVHVIFLSTPLDQCLESIQQRRDERGDVRPLDPKNTTDRMKRLERIRTRLRDANVETQVLDREGAYLRVRELLHV